MDNKEVFENIVEDIENGRYSNLLEEIIVLSIYIGKLDMLKLASDGKLEGEVEVYRDSLSERVASKWKMVEHGID
jgi:hypothetical protein